jgi:Rod binding domain-containing protein
MISNSLPLPESAGSSHSSGRANLNQSATQIAQDFESVFASMMLKEMRQSLEPGTMFGEDSGDIYGGLFDRHFGEQMTKGNGLGMRKMVEESIARMERAGRPITGQAPAASVTPSPATGGPAATKAEPVAPATKSTMSISG